jgi:putative phosphoribosyl transferase
VKLSGRTVIVVDDGIATGASMRVAVEALRPRQPARVVIAVPVAPADCRVACQHRRRIRVHACRRLFPACGEFYENFDQTTDMQARALFARSHEDAL